MNKLIKNENIILHFDRPEQAKVRARVRDKILAIADREVRHHQEKEFLGALELDRIRDDEMRHACESYSRQALALKEVRLEDLGPSADLQLRDAFLESKEGALLRHNHDEEKADRWQHFEAAIDYVLAAEQSAVAARRSRTEKLKEWSSSELPPTGYNPGRGMKR